MSNPYAATAQQNVGPYRLDRGLNRHVDHTPLLRELLDPSLLADYPSRPIAELVDALAQYHDVLPEQIVVGAGCQELIQLIMANLETQQEVLLTTATYDFYEVAARTCGRMVKKVTTDPLVSPLFAMTGALEPTTGAVIVDSPSNPMGVSVRLHEVEHFARTSDTLLVVDEEYVEYGAKSCIGVAKTTDTVVVLRSFSKWAGLPGVRVGYAVAPRRIAGRLRAMQAEFPISGMSAELAKRAITHKTALLNDMGTMHSDKQWLVDTLSAVPGLIVHSGSVPFVVFRHSGGDTEELHVRLREQGIYTKLVSVNDVAWIRMTVALHEDNKQIVQHIRSAAHGLSR
ncbi:MAG TPA: histidinol-phosphate transaminase [Candidatus Nanoperiomorbaceae bacterium]|nr:histidinol-phosphate transaminase [Candidatus Nanoperiomorbaceae bacterium]